MLAQLVQQKQIILFFIFIFSFIFTDNNEFFAQNQKSAQVKGNYIIADTSLANNYFKIADSLLTARQYDSSIVYFKKASLIYIETEMWQKYFRCESKHATNLSDNREYEKALKKATTVIEQSIKRLGENNIEQAYVYFVIGNIYKQKQQFDKSLEYIEKAFVLQKTLLGKKHLDVATSSYAIVPLRYTIAYERAGGFADALHSCFAPLHNCTEHWLNTIPLSNLSVCFGLLRLTAARYISFASVNMIKSEYDLALEYFWFFIKVSG